MSGIACFAASLIFVCIAHIIRVVRWKLFIGIYERPDDRSLFKSLSIGYLINYFVPFKLGDVLRAWISGRKMKSGKSLGFSTVIVDRYLDIVAVGAIFIFMAIGNIGTKDVRRTVFFYVISMLLLLGLAFAIYVFRGITKKAIKAIASIFNNDIDAAILSFAWALIWNFKDIFQRINKVRLVCTTAGMWIFYLISYSLFAEYLSLCGAKTTWADMFLMLFTQDGIKESTGIATLSKGGMPVVPMIIYMVFPTMMLFVFSLIFKEKAIEEDENVGYLNLLPHLDSAERLDFLENYFSDKNREFIASYLKINQDISIIRDYSAGSNATTMLCINDERTFFRKYAFGDTGEKLYEQIFWLEENKDRLALPEILKKEKTDLYCYYDMPYNSNSVGLFEYIHSVPVKQGWQMIQKALESLEHSIYKIDARRADRETIHKYIESKVKKNLNKIRNAKRIHNLQQYESIYINGVKYPNLSAYDYFLSEEYLQKVFKNDMYAVIHGDLTIENIICTRDDKGKDDFYIIDPNTGNVHDSPNLDYGKILQSIHGGYEFLMSTKNVKVVDNRISFIFTKSSAYSELHKRLKEYMQENFGYEGTKSIYFHEIIHWIRLMPYKIEKNDKRELLFYAGMLMVMNDVVKWYGDD